MPELRIVGPAEPCDGRDGEWPVEWDGGHGLLVVRRLKAELKGDSLMHRGFCTDCGAYAALGENDRCAACDAWRHREEERRDHV